MFGLDVRIGLGGVFCKFIRRNYPINWHCIDEIWRVEGNPYVQPKATFMKKNVINGSVEANSVSSMAIKGGLFGEIDSALLEE